MSADGDRVAVAATGNRQERKPPSSKSSNIRRIRHAWQRWNEPGFKYSGWQQTLSSAGWTVSLGAPVAIRIVISNTYKYLSDDEESIISVMSWTALWRKFSNTVTTTTMQGDEKLANKSFTDDAFGPGPRRDGHPVSGWRGNEGNEQREVVATERGRGG
jgi:hypothetical protein